MIKILTLSLAVFTAIASLSQGALAQSSVSGLEHLKLYICKIETQNGLYEPERTIVAPNDSLAKSLFLREFDNTAFIEYKINRDGSFSANFALTPANAKGDYERDAITRVWCLSDPR